MIVAFIAIICAIIYLSKIHLIKYADQSILKDVCVSNQIRFCFLKKNISVVYVSCSNGTQVCFVLFMFFTFHSFPLLLKHSLRQKPYAL